ncbi:hypothetical protein O0I10_003231 [Lichtheimia ornata]|uniref:Uncharacterized protein n=1 Tax=Lichtheimia ornata TaxID=688661 RepID=A0AAD7XXQ6_9FUNG|nr:uncharacterized protein O0I10_003231 [Lichtheimia ornata]KAJ8661009.1 hypothetical protein O0I10_003231 [Lichtheimia ornata]
MTNDNTNDQSIRDLEAEGPGVPLSDLLVDDIEPRAITTHNDGVDDLNDGDNGAMDQQAPCYPCERNAE